MEVLAVRAVEHVEAVLRVLGGVRVDDVHEHGQAQAVGLVGRERKREGEERERR
jgi:hypothetical protein